jgi:hypothetical protein
MATNIREVLDSISDEDRRFLQIAFEHELAQFVKLKDHKGIYNGEYIGVNCHQIKNLTPQMTAGVWSVGKIAEPPKEAQ